jgi:hypothetical protein
VPPIHVLPHIVRAGGIPAGIGVVIALFLGWPQADVVLPSVGSSALTLLPTYHNSLGGSGMTQEAAFGTMAGWAIGMALVGLLIGFVLIQLGVAKKDELGMGD